MTGCRRCRATAKGGGGGNRTRVLKRLDDSSPSAADGGCGSRSPSALYDHRYQRIVPTRVVGALER